MSSFTYGIEEFDTFTDWLDALNTNDSLGAIPPAPGAPMDLTAVGSRRPFEGKKKSSC